MKKVSNIRAYVLLNLINLLQKEMKYSASLTFYLLTLTCLINSLKHEHSCKILYLNGIFTTEPLARSALKYFHTSDSPWCYIAISIAQMKMILFSANNICMSVEVFRIVTEFRILRLTFHRMESQSQNAEYQRQLQIIFRLCKDIMHKYIARAHCIYAYRLVSDQ